MNSVLLEKDKEAITKIIKEMAESMTGEQSTRHWTEDTIWFDIPAFASKGIKPATQFFDRAFDGLAVCKIDILEMETVINGNMAIVCMVQRISTASKDGTVNKPLLVRQTDCFEKRNGEWKVIHEHTSVPKGAEWNGEIVRE
ncbi:MAG: nuclear transport factor 2 family protein [Candidatus Symbiothrix sp.]|jgi:ketosteroid isomerase-like protein|nr:nuclear transport factor 2 family protein [Candidatus Symbiothrix sp.]